MRRPESRTFVSVPASGGPRRLHSREWPRIPRKDPHSRLIAQLLELAGANSSVIATSTRSWASATFIGARHRVTMRFANAGHDERATLFGEKLPEADFSIAGHIVADICVDERRADIAAGGHGETIVTLSALTIEDW